MSEHFLYFFMLNVLVAEHFLNTHRVQLPNSQLYITLCNMQHFHCVIHTDNCSNVCAQAFMFIR